MAPMWRCAVQTNQTPTYDASDNATDCCPRFHPEGWNEQSLHFEDKLFVKVKTHSIWYVPIDMAHVFKKTFKAIEDAKAQSAGQLIVMSRDLSPWSAEHYFAVEQPVQGFQTVRLSGDYRTKVYEGPYANAPKWIAQMQKELAARGERAEKFYFFYTTCPKCAKTYGRNYVVAIAELSHAGALA